MSSSGFYPLFSKLTRIISQTATLKSNVNSQVTIQTVCYPTVVFFG